MKIIYRCLILVLGIGISSLSTYRSCAATPQNSTAALSDEQVKVYGDFIDFFIKANFDSLLDKTFPLDLSGVDKDAACMRGLQLEDTHGPIVMHSLGPNVLRGHPIPLVDEQEESAILKQKDANAVIPGGLTKDPGILALSEIAFDKSHRFAVMKYVFLCGSHCNSGAILVLEKQGLRWIGKTRRPCSFTINHKNPLR